MCDKGVKKQQASDALSSLFRMETVRHVLHLVDTLRSTANFSFVVHL
jgi:hypothetical protein